MNGEGTPSEAPQATVSTTEEVSPSTTTQSSEETVVTNSSSNESWGFFGEESSSLDEGTSAEENFGFLMKLKNNT